MHGILMPEGDERKPRFFSPIEGEDRREKSGPGGPAESFVSLAADAMQSYECGDAGPLAPGGQGVPVEGFVPGDALLLLPWVPEVEGFELEDPVFGAEPDAPLAVPGKVPHGELLGEVPGLFGLFGFAVDGCVVFPGAEGFVGLEPGALVFGVPLGDEEPGVVCPGAVCGVVAPVGGFTAPVGGAVGEPGVELGPALLEPPAGRAPPAELPPAELWATAQLAQHNTADSNVSFRDDMSKASRRCKLFQLLDVVTN